MADTVVQQLLEAVSSLKNLSLAEDLKTVGTMLNDLKKRNLLTSRNSLELISKIPLNFNIEKLIMMEVVDLFRLSGEVIKALKSDDLFLVGRALKCSWFFADDCDLLADCSLFVENFLIHLSLSSRHQVLKNYGRFLRDQTKAEHLFVAIETDYGTKESLILLPACSEEFISSVLDRKVKLSDSEALQLFLYHPAFTINYISKVLDEAKKNNHFYVGGFQKVFLRLISKDTRKFMDLFNDYGDLMGTFKLGRVLTKKIVKMDFESVLKHANNYIRLFQLKTLMSCLSVSQIKELHLALMPATMTEFKNSFGFFYNRHKFMTMLSHMSKASAQEIMLNSFIEKYQTDPLNVSFDLNEEFIEFLPKSYRSKWAEKKISAGAEMSFEDKVKYTAYLESNSLSSLKKMLPEALTSEKRCKIIGSMFKSIRMNMNFSDVDSVILFVMEKLRNDVDDVKFAALSSLADTEVDELELEHWSSVMHFIELLKLTSEDGRNDHIFLGLLSNYVRARLRRGLEVGPQLREMLAMSAAMTFELDKGDQAQHLILDWFNDNLHTKQFTKEEKRRVVLNLFKAVNDWNARYPQKAISQKDWVVDYVFSDECLKNYWQDEIFRSVGKHPILKRKLFDITFPGSADRPEVFIHKLHNDPAALLEQSHEVFKGLIKGGKYVLTMLRLYNRGDLVRKVKQHCIACLKDEEQGVGDRSRALIIYSYLCSGGEYLSLMEGYYPEGERAEVTGSEARIKYRLQTAAAAGLNHVSPPHTVLPALLGFARGDYLKITVGSLVAILTKTSQTKSVDFINRNLNSPVSFRKHLLRVYKLIAPEKDTCKIFFKCFKTERNLSMRVLLLKQMFSLLKQQDAAWACVKEACGLLTYGDVKQVPDIYNLSHIPDKYHTDYIETIWLKLDELSGENDIRMKIFSLITSATVQKLSDEFCTLLFHLTYTRERIDPVWNSYISLYLLYSPEEKLDSRLSLVTELIASHFRDKWEQLNDQLVRESHSQLCDLLDSVCSECHCKDADPARCIKALTLLKQRLLRTFNEIDIITEIFNLSLHVEFLKNGVTAENLHQVPFTSVICSLVDHYCSAYGEVLVSVFLPLLRCFISERLASDEFDVSLLVVHRIVTSDTSKRNLILALQWLQELSGFERQTDINRFKEIIKVISASNDSEIKILSQLILSREHILKID